MNKRQAAERWEVSIYKVNKICSRLGIPTNNIPDDTVPIYIPDGRYKKDPHRFYIYVLDVIINGHLILKDVDLDIIETCVEQLKNSGLIILKRGRDNSSVDYHDFMISPNRKEFYEWKGVKMKHKMEMITSVLSPVGDGVSTGIEAVAALS